MSHLDRAKKSLALLLGFMLWVVAAPSHAAIVTWDGGGADNNWNTCANWELDSCPTNVDVATFNTTSIKDVSITADPNVEGIDIQTGYTGIITQNPGVAITIGASNYIQAAGSFAGGDSAFQTVGFTLSGGTFTGGSATIQITDLTLSGGTFTATSGLMTIDDDFIFSGGTFNHGTGTITFTGGGNAAFIFDVVPTLNHVIFNRTNRIDISGLTPTLDINGNFTMSNSTDIDGGMISMAGNIITTDTAVTGNSAFTVDGNNIQTIDGSGVFAALPNLTINKTGGSLTFLNNISFNQNFTHVAGAVDTTTNDVTIQFGLTGSNATSTINSGTMQFNHIILNKTNHFYVDGIMDINGNLTIDSAVSLRDTLATDKITLAGNLLSNDATIVGGLEIEFDGITDQTITTGSNDISNGLLRVNKASGVLRLLANLDLSLNGNTTADLTVTQGTLDLNGFNLTVSDLLTVEANGTFQLQGDETVSSTTQTLAAGSTVIYDGAVMVTGLVMGSNYHHLIFNNATTGRWTLDAPLSVNGDLTITDGMLDTDGASNFAVNVLGSYAQTGGQMIANSSTLTVGGNFTGDVTTNDADYNSASVVLTGTGSLALNNVTSFWINGFNNLTVGQSSNTTTFEQVFTVRNVLTVGSGELTTTGTGRLHLTGTGNVLALDPAANISLQALKFHGNGVIQNLPTLNNGYDTDIALSGLNTTVTQTGNVTLNGANSLRIFGDTVIDRINTYNTGGFDLNVGGNIEIGAGNDTALKRLNAGSSAITVGGDFTIADIGTGTVQADFIAGTSTVTLNGTAPQSVTTVGSAFNNLTVTNASNIVTFADALTTTNLTAITANTQLEFTDSTTHTVSGTLNLNGQAALSEVVLTSTSPGVQFSLDVGATNPQTVNYVSVRDSNALGSDITAFNSVNATGNDDLASSPQWVFSNDLLVTNTLDDLNPGSLRYALSIAAANDTILFDTSLFQTGSPQTITLGSTLALGTGSVTIDGSNAGVIIDGSSLGANTDCLTISSSNNQIMGLRIQNCTDDGIYILSGTGNTIGGNNTSGSGPSGEGNVIISNGRDGVQIDSNSNFVYGNFVGTDGNVALGNSEEGINITSDSNTIGGTGTGQRNIISGNTLNGINLNGAASNTIQGNYIGTDINGTVDLGNLLRGINIFGGSTLNTIGGTTAAARNIISGNNSAGIRFNDATTMNNTVIGNYIGTDVSGTLDLGNSDSGIDFFGGTQSNTIGGTAASSRNIISGNDSSGITLNSSSNMTISANYIGTDVSGTIALGNISRGIEIIGGGNNTIGGNVAGAGNVVVDSGSTNINISGSTSNTVTGNIVGLNAAGNAQLGSANFGVSLQGGAASNTIGGTSAATRNIISGHNSEGVRLSDAATTNNVILGNYIGTDIGGTANLGNGIGIQFTNASTANTIGGTVANSGNVVAWSTADGIYGNSSGSNTLLGNYIGTNASSAAMPNGGDGIDILYGTITLGNSGESQNNIVGNNSGLGIRLRTNGTLNLGGTVDINDDVELLASSTLNMNAATLLLSGNWINSGASLDSGTSTINFDGTAQTISGSTTFYNLTKNTSIADTLTFQNGQTQIIIGAMNLQGTSGNYLALQSNTGGLQWNIDPQGSRTVAFLSVSDSNNINVLDIDASVNSIDSGNNTRWLFAAIDPFTWTGADVGNNNWDDPDNWFGLAVPTFSDAATFSPLFNVDADINVAINVQGIQIENGYSSTITQQPGNTVTLGSSGYLQAGGTFTGGDSLIDVNGNFQVSGGSFSSTNNTLTVSGNFTLATGAFTHNSGTVTLDSTTADQTVTSAGNSFNNLSLNNTASAGNNDVIIADALDVDGTLGISNGDLDIGTNDPTINTAGNVGIGFSGASVDSTGRSATWTFDGVTSYNDTSSSSQDIKDIVITGRLNLGGITLHVRTINVTATGILNLGIGAYRLRVNGTGTPFIMDGTLELPGASLFEYTGTGSPTNITNVPYSALRLTPTAPTTYSLTGNQTGSASISEGLIIDSNATLDATVSDFDLTTLGLTNSGTYLAQNSTITNSGNWVNNGTFTAGGSSVTLNGTGTQSITSGGSAFNNLTVTNAANIVTFADALTTANLTAITPNTQLAFANTITHTVSGTLNLNGQASGTEVAITSTTPGSQFSLDVGVSNPQGVRFVNVSDSNALGSDITAFDSVNGSGNDDTPPASPPQWVFSTTAPYTWTNNNGSGDNNWSTPSNWSGGTVPSVSDIAIFNGAFDYPATINTSPNVAGIQIFGGYSSTITQQNGTDLTIGSSGYSQSSGTFIGGDATSTVDLNGAMVINGGTYTATAGSTTLASDLTISGSAVFNRNSGTFTFDTPTTRTIDVGSAIFNNVTLNQSGGNFNVTGTMDVDGTFTIIAVNSINSGTIAVSGDVITQDSGVGGDGLLLIDGINQTLRRDGLGGIGAIPGIEINNTGTLLIDDVIQLDGTSGWTFTNGAVDAISLDSTIVFDGANSTFITDSTTQFNNVELSFNGASLTVNGTMDVDGMFTISSVNNITTGTIMLSGDLITTDTNVSGTGRFLFDGVNQELYSDKAGATGAIPGIEINNTGTLTIFDNIQIEGTTGWTLTAGNVDATTQNSKIDFMGPNSRTINDTSTIFNDVEVGMAGGTLTVTGNMNIDGDFSLTGANSVNGGLLTVAGDLTLSDATVGGTASITLDGGNPQTINSGGTGDLPNGTFTIAKSANTATLASNLILDVVGQDLLVSSGSFDLAGFDLTLTASGDVLTVASGATLQLQGGETVTASTVDLQSGSTVEYIGTLGPYTVKDWGYQNLIINGSGSVFNLGAAESISQNLTITAGTFDLSSFDLAVTGTFNNDDTLRLQGNETVTLSSGMDTDSGTVEYGGAGSYAALAAANNYFNLVFNGPGSWAQNAPLDINGDLTITNGIFNSAGQNLNLAGNWANSATYTSGSNTVTLDGAAQTLSGSSNFNNLTKTTASGTLTFQDGTTQTISGLATLQGSGSGAELALRSSTPGIRANIAFNGATSFNFLDVRDSNASPSTITKPLNPVNSVNSGNTIDWFGATTDAVTSVVAEIAPNSAVVSTASNAFDFYILPTITGSDSGINQTIITAPAGYSNFSIATVLVNSVPLTAGTACPALSAGEYCAAIAGQNMTLNFGTAITVNQTPIQVNFTADAPNTTGSAAFIFTVDDTTTLIAPQVGIAGDADLNPANSNSLDVNITPPGNATTSIIAEVTPSTAGSNTTAMPFSFYLIPTIAPSDSGFNRTTITLPAGYANFNVISTMVNGAPLVAGALCPTVNAGEYCSSIAGQEIIIDFGTPITTSLTNLQVDITSDTPSTTGTATIAYSVDDTSTGSVPPQSGAAGNADGNPTNSNNLNVTLVAVDATLSTVTIDPEMIIADGSATGTITVTLLNSNGLPVSGKSILISTNRGAADTIVQPIGVTNANGVAQGAISSSTLGTTTLTATNTTDGITLTSTPQAHFTQGQVLSLITTANKSSVVVGDLVTYTIEVRNATNNAVQQVRIEATTPDNFKYRSGSTLLNNVPAADPSGNRTRTFSLGTVPALIDSNGNGVADPGEIGYVKYSYQLIVGSGALPGSYINSAVAKDVCDTCLISNSSTAEVSVTLDPLFDLGTIIGKVFHDKNRDGWQDQNEEGIAGAMVVLDEGTYALTDSHGRYHFPAVTPGERLLKINLATLPSGTTLSNSETQVISVTPSLLAKANFGVTQNLIIKKIGHPGIRGVVINISETPKETILTGSTKLQTIIVNGSQIRLPSAEVRMNVNGIPSEVLDFSGKKLVHPARFYTKVSQPEEIKSWQLSIMTPEGKSVMDFNGSRAPPEVIEWNGYDKDKNQLEGGSLYHYQLTIHYANGDHATSARRLIGVDQRSVIELNLSGGSFKAGDFSLSKSAMEMLKDAAATLRRFPREQVVIEGHADSSGNQQANLDLSKKRAEAAHAYLVGVEGISPMRLKLRWYGEEKPIANNDSTEGRLLNRRIAMKGLVSDITRANRRSRFYSRDVATINGEPLALDRLGRFSMPIEENKVHLIELSNRHGRSISASLSVPQLLISQPKDGVLISHDSNQHLDSALNASTSDNALLRYQLVGKTEPGSLVQIGSTKIATSDDGTFEYPLALAFGEQSRQLVIYGPKGFTYITELNMNVRSHNDLNSVIYLQDPVPELQLDLPPTGFTLKEGSYTLSGSTSPDNVVLINDKVINVEPDGRFIHTLALKQGENPVHVKAIDPRGYVGTIEHTIGAGEAELFFMAFADGKFSQLNTKGYIQGSGQKSASEFYSEGRLAFYLKGKILGKYLITAALDTGQNEIGALFKDLDDDGSKALLSNLDPDYYYPVYGDNSTLVYDAQSQGKFYLAVNSDTINGVIGNYKLNLTDNELASYRRTLYGGLFEYQSLSRTKYGKQKTVVRLFGAQTRQSYARDELRATGGSLYYMSQRDIIEGSEQVSLIVKDKNTGLTLSRQPQQQNVDYSIKYLGGRILFTRPISSTQQDDNIINDALLAGNPVYIEVDYEYYVTAFEKRASGLHARQQLGDRIAIGATYVDDKLAAGRYELQGLDGEIRIMENSRIIAEIAESSGSEGDTFTSNDGGLTYAPISTGQQTGQATKVAAEIDIGEFAGKPDRLIAGAYIKDLDPGFQARGNSSDQGKQKRGADITIRVTDKNTLKLKHDQEKSTAVTSPGGIDSSQQSTAQWRYKAEKWSLTGEYHDQQSEGSSGTPLNQDSLAAAKLVGSVTEKLEASISHQTTLEGVANDQSTLGLKYDLTEHLHLQGSATSGDRGDAGEARIGYRSDTVSLYLAERLNDNQSGRSTSTIIGGETSTATIAGAESGKVYSEYQWDNNTRGDKSLSLVGAEQQWKIENGWKFNLSSEYSDINTLTGTTSRTTVAIGMSYMRKGLKMNTRNEVRNDRGSVRKKQLLTSNTIEYNLNPDYIVLGKYRYSITRNLTTGNNDARFDEQSIGLAYRPTRNDRLNALARLTRLSDMSPLSLDSAVATTTQMDVFSIEWSYQITKKLEWSAKQALRLKTEQSASYAEFETQTHLSINRLNYALPRQLYFGAEYRTLTQKEANDQRAGWLSEIAWEAKRYLRLGIGYNFTDFSDNEFSANDYSTAGWFIRIQGKY